MLVFEGLDGRGVEIQGWEKAPEFDGAGAGEGCWGERGEGERGEGYGGGGGGGG